MTATQTTPLAAPACPAAIRADVRPFARLRIERALAVHYGVADASLADLSLHARDGERCTLDRVNGRAVISVVLTAVGASRIRGGRREHAWAGLDARGGQVSQRSSWWLGLRAMVRFESRPAWLSLAEWDSDTNPVLAAAAFGLALQPLAMARDEPQRMLCAAMERSKGHDGAAWRGLLARPLLLTRGGGVSRAIAWSAGGWRWRAATYAADGALRASVGLPEDAAMLGAHVLVGPADGHADGPRWLDVAAPVCVAGPACARAWDQEFTAEDAEDAEKAETAAV
jgi:hypothetical protein